VVKHHSAIFGLREQGPSGPAIVFVGLEP